MKKTEKKDTARAGKEETAEKKAVRATEGGAAEPSRPEKERPEKSLTGPLCKLVKKGCPEKHFTEYVRLVGNPRYVCAKCGRAAHGKKSLCEPRKMEPAE